MKPLRISKHPCFQKTEIDTETQYIDTHVLVNIITAFQCTEMHFSV